MRHLLLLTLLLPPLLRAQDPPPTPPHVEPTPVIDAGPEVKALEGDLASLNALLDSIRIRENRKQEIYERIRGAEDPVEGEKLRPELDEIDRELADLRRRFQDIAIKTDAALFDGEPEKEFDLQSELEKLLEPLLAEVEKATKESRELNELNSRLETNRQRKEVAATALEELDILLRAAEDEALRGELSDLKDLWSRRLRDAENQITVVKTRLSQRERERRSLLEQTRGVASGFVRNKGMNFLLGVLAFAAVFFAMRGIQAGIRKLRPGKKRGKSFSSRLATLLWTLLSAVASVGAMLAVFNATGDVFLLSLTLVFLLGVGWAGMKALPAFLEQIRMMLNMGAVREEERLEYEGLPWKVSAIGFRTDLVNPLLDGGEIQVPTRMLVGLLSRPPGQKEEWFPSRGGDWVVLSDGLFGRVSYQTPSAVQITSPGGSQKVIPTARYLDLAPTVLSTGFRREIVFGIDYDHQPDVLEAIPHAMETHLRKLLEDRLGDDLKHLQVQFGEAADSSLNLTVWVDCAGGAASRWNQVPMWVQQGLVELCNREGWGIPFPQLRVHR